MKTKWQVEKYKQKLAQLHRIYIVCKFRPILDERVGQINVLWESTRLQGVTWNCYLI